MQSSKFYYGWYVVGACFMSLFVQAGIGFYAFGVFFTPLEKEFGWSRAAIAASMSIGNVVSGFSGPFVGRLTDTLGPRKVMITGAAIMGIALMALNGVSELWQFYLIFFISAMGRAGLTAVQVGTTLSKWFRHRRGLAMGAAATGIGFGGLIMAPLTDFLISLTGWRPAIVVMGLITMAAVIPIVAIIVRRSPQEIGLRPYGEEAEIEETARRDVVAQPPQQIEGLTFQQALRTASFWFISVAFLFVFLGQGSVLLHTVPFFIDQGIDPTMAASILALLSGVGIVGKLGMGYLSDKFPTRFVMASTFLMQSVGLIVILLPMSPVTIPAFIIFYGIGMGGTVALQPTIAAETFGVRSFGTILGGLSVLGTFSQATGPMLAGYVFDTTRSYELAFSIFLFTATSGAIAICLAKPVVGAVRGLGKVAAH